MGQKENGQTRAHAGLLGSSAPTHRLPQADPVVLLPLCPRGLSSCGPWWMCFFKECVYEGVSVIAFSGDAKGLSVCRCDGISAVTSLAPAH